MSKKGHKAIDCRSWVLCKIGNGRYHVSLRAKPKDLSLRKGQDPEPKLFTPSGLDMPDHRANIASFSGYSDTTSSAGMHTAKAVVNED